LQDCCHRPMTKPGDKKISSWASLIIRKENLSRMILANRCSASFGWDYVPCTGKVVMGLGLFCHSLPCGQGRCCPALEESPR
jgi:hypothetical protein